MNNKHTRLSNVDELEVIQVVRVKSIVGEGTKAEPVRQITEYFSLEGVRLARIDFDDHPEEIHKWEGDSTK